MIKIKKPALYVLLIIVTAALITLTILIKLNPTNALNNSSSSNNNSTNINVEAQDDFLKIKDCFVQSDPKVCLDNFISGYAVNNPETKIILNAMEVARTQDSGIENDCHNIAHAIGRYTYKKYSNIGDAFNACDQSCHSGCYHGVMERMFYSDEEISTKTHLTFKDIEAKMPGVCDSSKFSNPSPTEIFQCLHGVGHAVLFSLDYNLEDSLKACDLLANDYERSSCWGGVIMENVTAFDKKKRDLKAGDYLYPCNKLDDKYQYSCYMMQTSVMFEYGLTADQIGEQCKLAKYPNACFISLGRDLSNFVRTGDIDYVRRTCENLTDGDYRRNCLDGSIYALIDNTWDAQFAFKFCNSMQTPSNKYTCYKDSINYLRGVYQKNNEQITQECELHAGSELNVCKENILLL